MPASQGPAPKTRTRSLPLWSALPPLLVLGIMLMLFLAEPLPLQTLRTSVFDLYQQLQPREYEPVPVKILDIDEASLARLGQWPWPRTRLAEMVEQLDALGAAAVVFDVIFAEPDRTSPQRISEHWPLSPDLRAQLATLPDHDHQFAAGLRGRPVVLGYALEPDRPATSELTGPWRYVERGQPAGPFLRSQPGLLPSLPELVAAAAGHGAISFVADHDGVVRRVPLVLGLQGQPVPTLVSEALRVALGEQVYLLRSADTPGGGLLELRSGPVAVPLTRHGELWVHYTRPQAARSLSAWRAFPHLAGAAALGEEDVAGQIVFVGSSAQGLMDLRFSPLGGVIPGVESHAQAMEQILLGHFLERPESAVAIELVLLLVGGLLLGACGLLLGALPAAAITLSLLIALVAGAWWAFAEHSLLFDPSLTGIAWLLSFVCASLMRHLASEQRQRYLKSAFARYVSPNLVEHLVSHPDALALGGERRECSFVFTDLAGFTSLMEDLDPAQAVNLLNAYLDGMIRIAFTQQGTLDRIVGDAVAILFSAPLPQADHAARALRCALEMREFSDAYAATLQAQGIPFGRTRIGVHSGEVIVGNFGGGAIFDYRALGDAVNTAARLESVNKHLGTWICASEACLQQCPQTPARPVGRLVLKGKHEALMVHEVLPPASPEAEPERLAAYRTAYAQLRPPAERNQTGDDSGNEARLESAMETGTEAETLSRAANARAAFQELAERYPDDALIGFQLRRLQAGACGDRIVMSEK